jgi:superfamily II DNA or RNA helicase
MLGYVLMNDSQRLQDENNRLKLEVQRLRRENALLRGENPDKGRPAASLTPQEKIELFLKVFRGRQDVFALRWESRTGKTGYSPAHVHEQDRSICRRPKNACRDLGQKLFVPLDTEIAHQHLTGRIVAGIYPLLPDDTCWFLAVDFDKSTWFRDAHAFRSRCAAEDLPCYVERSRSGNGAHVWIFFSEPVPARDARALGTSVLSHSVMEEYPIAFDSFDRLFPNQATLPKGGFGNLIALPLQRTARDTGNSVFIDEDGEPYPDQWAVLASIRKVTPQTLSQVLASMPRPLDRALSLSTGAVDDDQKTPRESESNQGVSTYHGAQILPWDQSPTGGVVGEPRPLLTSGEPVKTVRGNLFYIEKKGLPMRLQNRLSAIAAFGNPDFYKAQKQRLPVWNKPRVISCSDDFPDYIGLPRGCEDDATQLLRDAGADVRTEDRRDSGSEISALFVGMLSHEQTNAVESMLTYDCGVLSAPTGFGKTVAAAAVIAARKRNTLILVHRKRLAEQWRDRLREFLDLPDDIVTVVGADKTKASGIIDVVLFQSLFRNGVVHDLVANYGHVIVDECHHVSAYSFEQVLKQVRAVFVLGLTATPIRQDGRHPIIHMQCGPIRHRVDERAESRRHGFEHTLIIRETSLVIENAQNKAIYEIYAALVANEERNDLIADDVLQAVEEGRTPLVLSERKRHLELLKERIEPHVDTCATLVGGIGKKHTVQALESLERSGRSVLLATGKLIGEGFDHPRLDTLFLTFPVSWKGIVYQYVGRLHRSHTGKDEARVYDYLDSQVPVLAASFRRRMKSYDRMGYVVHDR